MSTDASMAGSLWARRLETQMDAKLMEIDGTTQHYQDLGC